MNIEIFSIITLSSFSHFSMRYHGLSTDKQNIDISTQVCIANPYVSKIYNTGIIQHAMDAKARGLWGMSTRKIHALKLH